MREKCLKIQYLNELLRISHTFTLTVIISAHNNMVNIIIMTFLKILKKKLNFSLVFLINDLSNSTFEARDNRINSLADCPKFYTTSQ